MERTLPAWATNGDGVESLSSSSKRKRDDGVSGEEEALSSSEINATEHQEDNDNQTSEKRARVSAVINPSVAADLLLGSIAMPPQPPPLSDVSDVQHAALAAAASSSSSSPPPLPSADVVLALSSALENNVVLSRRVVDLEAEVVDLKLRLQKKKRRDQQKIKNKKIVFYVLLKKIYFFFLFFKCQGKYLFVHYIDTQYSSKIRNLLLPVLWCLPDNICQRSYKDWFWKITYHCTKTFCT